MRRYKERAWCRQGIAHLLKDGHTLEEIAAGYSERKNATFGSNLKKQARKMLQEEQGLEA